MRTKPFPYHQITLGKSPQVAQFRGLRRCEMAQLSGLRLSDAVIARRLGQHRSMMHRELARNSIARGRYERSAAHFQAGTRRRHSWRSALR